MQRVIESMRKTDPGLAPFVPVPMLDVDGYINSLRKYQEITPDMENDLRAKYTPPAPPDPKPPKWKNPLKFTDDVLVTWSIDDTVKIKLTVPFEEMLQFTKSGKVIPMPVLVRCFKRCGAPEDILLGIIKRHELVNSDAHKQKMQDVLDRVGKKNPVKKVVAVKKKMIPK